MKSVVKVYAKASMLVNKISVILTFSDDFYLCLSLCINHSKMSALYGLRFHAVRNQFC